MALCVGCIGSATSTSTSVSTTSGTLLIGLTIAVYHSSCRHFVDTCWPYL